MPTITTYEIVFYSPKSKKFIIVGIILILFFLLLVLPSVFAVSYSNIPGSISSFILSFLIILGIASFVFGISLIIIGIINKRISVKRISESEVRTNLNILSRKINVLLYEVIIRASMLVALSAWLIKQ
ncbi:MAG: hypothetical protein QW350_05380, partial [Candidatus Aenigmatarchaeota archaeon]